MKIILIIFITLFIPPLAEGGNFYNNELLQSVKEDSQNGCEKKEKLPSPAGAAILAVFPGFFLHGMGHFYIGENLTGTLLFTAEGVGVLLTFFAATCEVLSDLSSIVVVVPTGARFKVFSETGGGNFNWLCSIGELGILMTWGSWFYDVIAAPIKASKMRKEYEKKKKEKENVLKPEIGFMPMRDKDVQSSSGEVSFLSSYYKVQNTMGDINGGMILLTWRW